MARNAEKAKAMWNTWYRQKQEYEQDESFSDRRPFVASDCKSRIEAERWRRQILSEIAMKINEIQNASLGEHKLRDMNDLINKLLREKGHWNRQIKQLGGPDYSKTEGKIYDTEGLEIQGYKYFGAAKDLPSVRLLFEEARTDRLLREERKKRKRRDLYKDIDADYYGFRDEEDEVILEMEKEREEEFISKAVEDFNVEKTKRLRQNPISVSSKQLEKKNVHVENINGGGLDDEVVTDDELIGTELVKQETQEQQERKKQRQIQVQEQGQGNLKNKGIINEDDILKAHVPNLPSQEEMQKAVLEKKKAALMAKLKL